MLQFMELFISWQKNHFPANSNGDNGARLRLTTSAANGQAFFDLHIAHKNLVCVRPEYNL